MKLALYGKLTHNTQVANVRRLLDYLQQRGIDYRLYGPYAEELTTCPEMADAPQLLLPTFSQPHEVRSFHFVYSLGGDGTLLDAANYACPYGIPLVGVNMGRLGFLTTTQQDEMIAITNELENNRYRIEERHMLKVESNRPELFGEGAYAMNEVTIHKSNSNEMITVHVYVNGEYLNTYWADGLIISTPTGSTAYNLACGGPIISPSVQGNVITPIAPHSLTVRPILLPVDYLISLQLQSRSGQALVALDHRTYPADNLVELAIRRADRTARLVRVQGASYYTTLRTRLNWGLDARN